ncbi:MAG: hypothetical protein K2P19_10595 [Kineothrix sp.]|nr:hypothetical protein [Kineothrix sp.]
MTDFFSKMNADYAQKHFPDGSVFESAMKTVKRRSIGGIFFFALFFAAALCGLVWGIGRTLSFMSNGEDDMLSVGIVICGFFGVIVLVCLLVLFFLIKGTRKKRSDYVADSAKHSKLPVSDIEAFEQQAVASDCYILKLTTGLDRLLSNATNKDGLLTRDYIYLADPAQTVMRVDSLKACCFSDYTYYINTGNRQKKIHCLAICLIASNGVSILSDTTEEAGKALIALLKQRNSAIDTNEGKVLPENAFDSYKKRVLEG